MRSHSLVANLPTNDSVVTTHYSTAMLDTRAPKVVSINATVDGPITILFDEAIQVSSGRISLLTGNLSMTLETFDLSSPAVTISGNTITFTPDHVLAVRSYSLGFTGSGIMDAAGNIFDSSLILGPFEVNTLRNGDAALSGLGIGGRVAGTDANARDTAVFSGTQDRYNFTKTATGHTVPGTRGEQTVELVSVERILFTESNDALALSAEGNLGQVYRLYQAAFDRTPDKVGFGFWLSVSDSGNALTTIAQSFIDSREFADLYGASTSNATFVDALYDNVLHRDGEAGGVAFWNGVLDQGTSRSVVLAEFAESAENRAQLAEVIGNGFTYTPYG